jgi:DNA-binding XRE family transcriptional regulator
MQSVTTLTRPRSTLLEDLRHTAHLSRRELADLSGVPEMTIKAIEYRGAVPKLRTAQRLARAFYVPTDALFPYEEEASGREPADQS